jgi:hypothetical protein
MPYSDDKVKTALLITTSAETWENEAGAYWANANHSDASACGQLVFRTIDPISRSAELTDGVLPEGRGAGAVTLGSQAMSNRAFTRCGIDQLVLHRSVHTTWRRDTSPPPPSLIRSNRCGAPT